MNDQQPILLPVGIQTTIIGAKEVWDAGGQVYTIPLIPGPDGEKYSTTELERAIMNTSI